MPLKPIITSLSLFLLILLGCNKEQIERSEESPLRPNIILINTDDLSPYALGPYGQKIIKTPKLDQIAKEGILFTQAYSSATSCAPSRISLLTGKHMGHISTKLNSNEDRIKSEDLCFPELLRDYGYITAMYGKHHGAHFRNWFNLYTQVVDDTPYDHGFDHFVGTLKATEAHQMYLDGITNPKANNPNHLWEERNEKVSKYPIEPTRYTHNEYMDLAYSFIKEQHNKPFFLYLPLQIPHFEVVVPKKGEPDYRITDFGLLEQYLDTITGESIFEEKPYIKPHSSNQRTNEMPYATFAGMISRLDRDIGKLIDELKRLDLYNNTIVFFTSDNGYGGWFGGMFNTTGPLKAAKGSLYEGGIRVPMIVAGGLINEPRIVTQPVVHYDIGTTILDLAGISSNFGDGISWKNVLIDNKPIEREHLYWENYLNKMRQSTLIEGRYKVIKIDQGSNSYVYEVFDLTEDISESNNLVNTTQGQDLLSQAHLIFQKEHIPFKNFEIN